MECLEKADTFFKECYLWTISTITRKLIFKARGKIIICLEFVPLARVLLGLWKSMTVFHIISFSAKTV